MEENRELVPAGLVLLPAPVEVIVKHWQDYQRLCELLLTDDDHSMIEGKKRRDKSAWRKLAQAFNVTDEIVRRQITRDKVDCNFCGRHIEEYVAGRVVSAEYEVKATAPNGRTSIGIAGCSIWERAHEEDEEDRWGRVCKGPCDGRKHFSNPDHTIPATAHTRAKNRAIADLIGAGEVSAEEIEPGGVVVAKARPADEMPTENPGEMVLGFSRSHRDKMIMDVPMDFLMAFVDSEADWAVGSRQKYPAAYVAVRAFLDEPASAQGKAGEGMEAGEAEDVVFVLPDGQEGTIEELQEALPMAEVREVARESDEELDEALTLKEYEGMCIHLRRYAAGAGWAEEKIRSLFERHHLDGDTEATKRMFVAAKDEVQLSVSEGRLEEAAE